MAKYSFKKSTLFQNVFTHSEIEKPIRGELYSVERLEQFAATLAADHATVDQPKRYQKLRSRLEENGQLLVAA